MIRFVFMVQAALCSALTARVAAQYFQLESYQFGGYFRTLKRNGIRAFLPGVLVALFGCAVVSALVAGRFEDFPFLLGTSLTLLFAILAYWAQRRLKAKKPLVFTPRVKRLAVSMVLCSGIASWLLIYALHSLSLPLLLPAVSPLLLALAALAALPVEKMINRLYMRDAMKRLDAMPDLIKIGITGSYGKTSTKFMLETILQQKYQVLVTPASFNTSMGVTRTVRERLLPSHQVFVAEMGARHLGDIALLCKIVRPTYGILTSVGPQHLETFHTQENICREKFTLAEAIPAEGAMVFGGDGGLNDELYRKATCAKHLAGFSAEGMGAGAKDIEMGPWGTRFTLVMSGEEHKVETRILGAHNIVNLLTAVTMARVLGMDMEQIARGVARLQPVEHRLQLLGVTGGVTVIDDAFNANPRGADAALDVLKRFAGGRRIIVTPGFVEMGAEEEKYNRLFGEHMVGCVDHAVLIGKRQTAPIAEGLRAKGFDEANLRVVASLSEATEYLSGVLKIGAGDVVLYENDLPDNYQE